MTLRNLNRAAVSGVFAVGCHAGVDLSPARTFPGGGQKGKPLTRPGMRCDYETPFVKFLLGALEQRALLSPPAAPRPSALRR
ncbi:unnamed protein product, partial [Iphiclides podalirius]